MCSVLGVYCRQQASKHHWGCCFFFLKRGHEALSLSGHRNLAIQAGRSNVARHHNLTHSRAHKHVDQTGLINPDYSTLLLNIQSGFHLFPFSKPPALLANMVLIRPTSFSRIRHISSARCSLCPGIQMRCWEQHNVWPLQQCETALSSLELKGCDKPCQRMRIHTSFYFTLGPIQTWDKCIV